MVSARAGIRTVVDGSESKIPYVESPSGIEVNRWRVPLLYNGARWK